MVPAVFPPVINLIVHHDNEMIRKKCCLALYALYEIQPQLVISEARDVTRYVPIVFPAMSQSTWSMSQFIPHSIRRALCDPAPSVMGASLHLIHALAKQDKESWKDLVPSLVSILKQIIEHRLPREYDYHRIPAPWLQVRIDVCKVGRLMSGEKPKSNSRQHAVRCDTDVVDSYTMCVLPTW